MRRVASRPSTSGIRTSISTTSGCSRSTSATASRAVAGLADHLEVGLGVEDHAEAAAHERLVVGEHDADAHELRLQRQAGVDAEAALGQRPGLERAAEHRRALAHPGDAAAAAVRGRRASPPRPSSRTSSSSTPGARAHGHLGAARARVAQRVRERLLDDPVGGQVDPRGQRGRVAGALARHRDLEPGGAQRLGELAEPVEPRLRVRRLAVGVRAARRRAAGAARRAPRAPRTRSSAARRAPGPGARRRRRRRPPPARRSPTRCARSRRAARARSAPARRRPPAATPARSRCRRLRAASPSAHATTGSSIAKWRPRTAR